MRSKLSQRLKQLRKERGISQVKLADALNINNITIAKIETGERSTSIETLIVIAEFFGVSTDYMLGLTDTL